MVRFFIIFLFARLLMSDISKIVSLQSDFYCSTKTKKYIPRLILIYILSVYFSGRSSTFIERNTVLLFRNTRPEMDRIPPLSTIDLFLGRASRRQVSAIQNIKRQ